MNWVELKNMLVDQTSTEDFNIIDDKYYEWLTLGHKKVAEMIKTRVDSKYFQSRFELDLSSGQKRYDNFPVSIVESTYLKYDESADFKDKVRLVDMQEMARDPEYYSENQSSEDPICEIIWNSIIIYPTPTKDVTRGLKVIWKKNVWDITAGTLETEVFNGKLIQYHDLIVQYAKRYVYQYTHEANKKAEAKFEFTELLDDMITEISYRGSQPVAIEEPDTSSLM